MLICFVARLVRCLASDPAIHARGVLGRHARSCPRCQRERESHSAVERELRAEAGRARVPEPPFLQARIAGAIRRESQLAPQSGRSRFSLAWRSVTGVALLVAAVMLWRVGQRDFARTSSEPGRAAVAEAPAPELGASVRSQPTSGLAGNRLPALSTWLEDPLLREIGSISNDTRRAIVLLAHQFLPVPER